MPLSLPSLLLHPTLGLRTADQLPSRLHSANTLPARENPAEKAFAWLLQGGIHEWFYQPPLQAQRTTPTAHASWHAPLTLLTVLVGRRCASAVHDGPTHTVWIGRKCWPTLHLLYAVLSDRGRHSVEHVLGRCLFLDPLSLEERCWAIGQALRCPGIAVVVADASGLTPVMSRRLQLAAEAVGNEAGDGMEGGKGGVVAGGCLGLLARPHWEQSAASWAASRWAVSPLSSDSMQPRWALQWICGKRAPDTEVPRRGIVDWSYEVSRGSGALHLSAEVGSRMDPTPETSPCFPDARTA